MKVLVTGSLGFIGHRVCGILAADGHSVYGVDLRECSAKAKKGWVFQQIDILDSASFACAISEAKPDAIIHLAARCDLNGKTLRDYDANVTGVRNLCEIVRKITSVKRIVVTSSQLVCRVGKVPKRDDEYCPNTVYGKSKVRTEEIVREVNGGGAEWCIARPTTVWGPNMSEHYQSLLRHIQKGTYFHSGGGKLFKSYSYAENIAHQYLKLLTAPTKAIHQKVFYLADYEPLSLRDYANRLADEMGVKRPKTMPLPAAKIMAWGGDLLNACGVRFPYNSFRLKNIRTEYIFDMEKTREVCGDLPKTFEEGVKETASWYLEKSTDK